MAASSQSDDASDIFWPGYVDAVTNLAINLLFVIAVMSIVVIGAVLQLSKMKPAGQTESKSAAKAVQAAEKDLKNLQSIAAQAAAAQSPAAPSLQQALQALSTSVQQQRQMAQEMAQMQASIGRLESRLAQTPSRERADAASGQKAQEVHARDKVIKPTPGGNQLQSNASGAVVVFDRDVIELSSIEGAQLIRGLMDSGSLAEAKWELRVAAPQGFSEAIRIAFYRLTSVRNALIESGVPAANIEMRVLEVASESANNNRVQVRRVPGS